MPLRAAGRPARQARGSQARHWKAAALAWMSNTSASRLLKKRPWPLWRSGALVSLPLLNSSMASGGSVMSKLCAMRAKRPQPSSDTNSCSCEGVCRIDTVTALPPLWSMALFRSSVKACSPMRATGAGSSKQGAKSRRHGRSSCKPASA